MAEEEKPGEILPFPGNRGKRALTADPLPDGARAAEFLLELLEKDSRRPQKPAEIFPIPTAANIEQMPAAQVAAALERERLSETATELVQKIQPLSGAKPEDPQP